MAKRENDLGRDPIGKLLLRLAVPTVTAQLVNALYHIVDRIYIGHIPGEGDLALTGLGMVGSPLPIWLMREDFLRQITEQGMPADYVNTLAALSSSSMLVVLFLAPVVGAIIGGFIARAMFRKHFEKAGLV